MIKAYYRNSKGEVLDFMTAPFRTVEADWFDSDWEEKDEGYEKTVSIDVMGKQGKLAANMEKLYSVIAVDAETGSYGRLYVNDAFLPCQIYRTKKTNWKGYVYAEVELIFLAPKLTWIRVQSENFYPHNSDELSGLDFPFDFPLDFANGNLDTVQFKIDHIKPSDFQMVIYGPCSNPKILLNQYPYTVNTTLEEEEYLIIDSQEQTVVKYLNNGTTESLFDARGFEYSVFEKIPSGMITVDWPKNYGFDLDIFLERKEAAW